MRWFSLTHLQNLPRLWCLGVGNNPDDFGSCTLEKISLGRAPLAEAAVQVWSLGEQPEWLPLWLFPSDSETEKGKSVTTERGIQFNRIGGVVLTDPQVQPPGRSHRELARRPGGIMPGPEPRGAPRRGPSQLKVVLSRASNPRLMRPQGRWAAPELLSWWRHRLLIRELN